MIKLLLCMIIILICVSGQESDAPLYFGNKSIARIIKGWRGKPGDVPYQVSFKVRRRKKLYENFCGGSIVAENKVLSAAHCFVNKPNFCHKFLHIKPSISVPLRQVYAVAGTVRNTRQPDSSVWNEQWRVIKDVNYPTYFDFPFADICVVVITRPFIFNAYVNYIPYATQNVEYSGTCLASGFGSTSRDVVIQSPILLLANASILPRDRCEKFGASGRKFICTAPPSGPIKGDSGGPLVCQNTTDPKENSNSSRGILVGVICGGFDRPPHYFVFTRVSYHKDLIDEYVNASCKLKGYLYYPLLYFIILF